MNEPGKFLIATWDGGGNTPPAYNLGARLVQRGHRVVAAAAPAQEIAATLMELLGDAAARREARRFAEVIAGLGGGEIATDTVEGLLPRPVTRRLHLTR
jgi:hypothetical protein